jgi:hypothetical protein
VYHLIVNAVGCLPDNDPEVVETWEEAKSRAGEILHDYYQLDDEPEHHVERQLSALLTVLEAARSREGFVLGLPGHYVLDCRRIPLYPTDAQIDSLAEMLRNQRIGDGGGLQLVDARIDVRADGGLYVEHNWREGANTRHEFWIEFDVDGKAGRMSV